MIGRLLRIPALLAVAMTSLAANSGCSGGSSAPSVDTKAVIEKASGGDGQGLVTPKAKANADEAAKKNPKLY